MNFAKIFERMADKQQFDIYVEILIHMSICCEVFGLTGGVKRLALGNFGVWIVKSVTTAGVYRAKKKKEEEKKFVG